MVSKKMDNYIKKVSEEAVHVLKITEPGKDAKEMYENAKATLDMIDIAVRMLISDVDQQVNKDTKNLKSIK